MGANADALGTSSSVLPEGTPVITVMRVAHDFEGRPVEMTDTVKSAPSYVLENSFPAT
jgi:GntR family transcriptional regulator